MKSLFGDRNYAKFSPSDKGIVSISKGVLTAKKKGEVLITAYEKNGGKYIPSRDFVVIVEKPVFSQKLSATRKGQIIEAKNYLSEMQYADVTSWTSSKNKVAEIDGVTGIITVKNSYNSILMKKGDLYLTTKNDDEERHSKHNCDDDDGCPCPRLV